MTNILRGSLLALAASVMLGGVALAGAKCEDKAAKCPVSAEVGNRAFFAGNRCSVQAADKAKVVLAKKSEGACATKSASACATKSASACAEKAAACGAATACADKEVGNRGFFTRTVSVSKKAAKSACCASKAE